jgi:ribosomal protein S18 acetylase RimI-like enzyme
LPLHTAIPHFKLENLSDQIAIPASHFNFEELAEIYNQSRVDYIVPMPMNARRMEEYIHNYDIDLDASAVSLNPNDEITGIGMLGVRDERAWITRLGVIPTKRGRKTGQFLVESLLHQARHRNVNRVQLEVIKGNDPAYNLFLKFGFQETRELLIIRRPPGIPTTRQLEDPSMRPLPVHEITTLLKERLYEPSWIEETRSMLKAGNLKGFEIKLENGDFGWIIFQLKAFQMEHVVFHTSAEDSEAIIRLLLYTLHQQYAKQDTKVENLPADCLAWPIFQEKGYVEAFRRIEMMLDL